MFNIEYSINYENNPIYLLYIKHLCLTGTK